MTTVMVCEVILLLIVVIVIPFRFHFPGPDVPRAARSRTPGKCRLGEARRHDAGRQLPAPFRAPRLAPSCCRGCRLAWRHRQRRCLAARCSACPPRLSPERAERRNERDAMRESRSPKVPPRQQEAGARQKLPLKHANNYTRRGAETRYMGEGGVEVGGKTRQLCTNVGRTVWKIRVTFWNSAKPVSRESLL